jgi:4-diphosphocytidyl-2-C-methyl-D-erythritol kinase
LAALAPAKLNLTLRIVGRRADGYHDLVSLVAFAPFGDRVTLRPGPQLALAVGGPTAGAAGPDADNLVLRAARALAERIDGLRLGRFSLTKRLPAGAGLGGGSSDAAAALRLIAQANGIGLDDPCLAAAARTTGADVPVCLDPRPKLMSGIGDVLSAPLTLPKLGIVVVHPGVAVATSGVFAALGLAPGERCGSRGEPPAPAIALEAPARAVPGTVPAQPDSLPIADPRSVPGEREALLAWLASERNDLQASAITIAPSIADVLHEIAALPGCRLARMSGSGSACFGLFNGARGATAAARRLRDARPDWWTRAGSIGG